MTISPTFIRRFLALTALTLFCGFGLKACPNQAIVQATQPFTITYWRVFDDADAFDEQFNAFRALHPHISIEYRRLNFTEYHDALLRGFAEGTGPDVVSLPATWMHEFQPYLQPVPATMSVPFREMQGTIKKELVTVMHQEAGMTLKQLANDYVSTVSADVVMPTPQADPKLPMVDRIYGLPLAVDTMALFYNRDILNRAGVAQPASDWKTFQEQVKKITKLDETGAIIQSAAALGTADNIERSSDILGLLMMQNGAPMTDANGTVTFEKYPPELAGRPYPPAAEALIFYTDFANPEKEVYTFNDKMPGSLQAFVNGQTAFFFGYSYHLPQIRLLNPKLNFGVSGFPQIEGNKPVNYANYWVEAVSKTTPHRDEVWSFVQFLAKADNAKKYLAKTRKPTAQLSLISSQLEDLDLSVFASQVPTAKNWYHGTNVTAQEQAFRDMIKQMLAGESDPKRIVELGATKVNQTVQ